MGHCGPRQITGRWWERRAELIQHGPGCLSGKDVYTYDGINPAGKGRTRRVSRPRHVLCTGQPQSTVLRGCAHRLSSPARPLVPVRYVVRAEGRPLVGGRTARRLQPRRFGRWVGGGHHRPATVLAPWLHRPAAVRGAAVARRRRLRAGRARRPPRRRPAAGARGAGPRSRAAVRFPAAAAARRVGPPPPRSGPDRARRCFHIPPIHSRGSAGQCASGHVARPPSRASTLARPRRGRRSPAAATTTAAAATTAVAAAARRHRRQCSAGGGRCRATGTCAAVGTCFHPPPPPVAFPTVTDCVHAVPLLNRFFPPS